MNRNKYIYVAALLSAVMVWPVQAQEKKIFDGKVSVTPYELKQRGDSLFLEMDIDYSKLDLKSRRSLTLVPVLMSQSNSTELPVVVINGKNRQKAYLRKQSLEKDNIDQTPYAVVRSDKQESIHYIQQIPFEGWMENARLEIVEDLCGCGGENESSARNKIFQGVDLEVTEVYQVQPHLAYVQPKAEEIKKRNEIKEVYLDFKVGSAVILPDLNKNYSELNKVETMLRDVKSDKNITVQAVNFKGYASPEGSVASNRTLSGKRAEAMRSYLMNKLSLNDYKSTADGFGEDWNGLKKLLSNSDIPSKEKLMEIIEECGTTDACEQKMKTISGGTPYQRMLREIYPQLRRTVCNVDYTVRGFSAEEGREVIKTHPQQLSLNEMYLVANTYEEGTEHFNEVFETAVRMYPEDDVANLNAATSAIKRNDLVLAQRYLDRVKVKKGEFANSQGVLYLLKGDYDKAENYLKQAVSSEINAAIHNLEELDRKEENNALWEKRKMK